MDWQKGTLDQLCEFKNGLWKGKKGPFINVGVIRNTNFTKGGKLDDSDIAYLDVEEKQYNTRKLKFGDLILEKSGGGPNQPVGRVIPFEKMEGEFSFSNFTSIIRIVDNKRLEYSFLHKFLHYLYEIGATEPMQRQSTGIRNLQLKEYKLVEVPLPTIPEQKRIVAILDKAFADIDRARAITEQNLKNARELFDSYLQQVFSQQNNNWTKCALSEICDVRDGTHDSPKYVEVGIPFVTQKNIRKDGLCLDNVKYIDIKDHEKFYKRSNVSEGDILISMIGANRGMACIVKDNRLFSIKNVGLIKNSNKMNMEYLLYIIKSNSVTSYIESESRGGAQPFIGLTKLRNIPVIKTTLLEQEIVVSQLSQIEGKSSELVNIYSKKLLALDELKKSILQKAFSGELTKNDTGAAA